MHQLFRVLYTLWSLDTANIYWWWCIKGFRVIMLIRHWIIDLRVIMLLRHISMLIRHCKHLLSCIEGPPGGYVGTHHRARNSQKQMCIYIYIYVCIFAYLQLLLCKLVYCYSCKVYMYIYVYTHIIVY